MARKTDNYHAYPKAMTVGEYAAWLLANFDADMPVHHRDGGGDFPPLQPDMAARIVIERELMRLESLEGAYTADTRDESWAKRRADFGPAFKALVIRSL
jgi:hypothetical protein